MRFDATQQRAWIAMLALLLSSPSLVAGSPEGWAWFRAESTGTAWWMGQGKADVIVSGRRFEAAFRDSQDSTIVVLSLRGSISDGLVKVRVTQHESDAPDFDVSGTLSRVCWDTKGGRETLLLADGQGVISLVRELDPSTPCKSSGPRRHWFGP